MLRSYTRLAMCLMNIVRALALVALGIVPAAGMACSIPPVLNRDLDSIPFIATGVIHIVSSERRALPLPGGGYEIKGIAELREARVLRNRHHHRGPVRIAFGFHSEPVCTFGHLLLGGEEIKVWLRSPEKRGEPLALFYYETVKRAPPRLTAPPDAPRESASEP
jgi:hypothetical protein